MKIFWYIGSFLFLVLACIRFFHGDFYGMEHNMILEFCMLILARLENR